MTIQVVSVDASRGPSGSLSPLQGVSFPVSYVRCGQTTVGLSSGALGDTIINSERGASRASASTFSSIMEEGGLSLGTYILNYLGRLIIMTLVLD